MVREEGTSEGMSAILTLGELAATEERACCARLLEGFEDHGIGCFKRRRFLCGNDRMKRPAVNAVVGVGAQVTQLSL